MVRQHAGGERGHFCLWPMPQALRITDVALEEIAGEIFRRVVGNIQVRSHLCIPRAIEAMARQAVFLEQCKTLIDPVVGCEFRVG